MVSTANREVQGYKCKPYIETNSTEKNKGKARLKRREVQVNIVEAGPHSLKRSTAQHNLATHTRAGSLSVNVNGVQQM